MNGKGAFQVVRRASNKTRLGNILFNFFNYLLFGLFALICIYPIYYILIYSLSSPEKAAMGLYLLPRGFTLNNYHQLLF